jgi:hypothetical protein
MRSPFFLVLSINVLMENGLESTFGSCPQAEKHQERPVSAGKVV